MASYFATTVIEAYLAFVHLDAFAEKPGAVPADYIIRHLSGLLAAETANEKLRKTFSDPGSVALLDEQKLLIATIRAQGEALLRHVRDNDRTARADFRSKKETARATIIRLLHFPDNRQQLP